MSEPRIMQYMFLCRQLYLHQFQCMDLQTIVLSLTIPWYNNVHACGKVEQNVSQTWRPSLMSSSIHVTSVHGVRSFYHKSMQTSLATVQIHGHLSLLYLLHLIPNCFQWYRLRRLSWPICCNTCVSCYLNQNLFL